MSGKEVNSPSMTLYDFKAWDRCFSRVRLDSSSLSFVLRELCTCLPSSLLLGYSKFAVPTKESEHWLLKSCFASPCPENVLTKLIPVHFSIKLTNETKIELRSGAGAKFTLIENGAYFQITAGVLKPAKYHARQCQFCFGRRWEAAFRRHWL